MNFLQRLCLLLLIAISVAYVYFSYFDGKIEIPNYDTNKNIPSYNPIKNNPSKNEETKLIKQEKNIKIYLLDDSGNLKAVNRVCNTENESSCFKFAIKELSFC